MPVRLHQQHGSFDLANQRCGHAPRIEIGPKFPTSDAFLQASVEGGFPPFKELAQAPLKLRVDAAQFCGQIAEWAAAPVFLAAMLFLGRFIQQFEPAAHRQRLVVQYFPNTPLLKCFGLLLKDLQAEVLLATKMIVKVAPANFAGIKDVVQRRRLESTQVEEGARRLDDPLAAPLVALHMLVAQRGTQPF